jgi:hypothetical protein
MRIESAKASGESGGCWMRSWTGNAIGVVVLLAAYAARRYLLRAG